MKKLLVTMTSLATLLLSANSMAAAAPSAELKVSGELVAPTCSVEIANSGVFEFGKIANSLIKPGLTNPLGASVKSLVVSCDASTYLTFTAVDNRDGTASATNSTYFGLGNVNGSGKLGYYQIQLLEPSIDGRGTNNSIRLFSAAKGASTITGATSVFVDKNKVTGWSGPNALEGGKVFAADMRVLPVLASSASMGGPITETTKLDGSATLNFAYGL